MTSTRPRRTEPPRRGRGCADLRLDGNAADRDVNADAVLPDVTRMTAGWWVLGVGAVLLAAAVGLAVGPVAVPPWRAALEVLSHLPFAHLDSGLDPAQQTVVWDLRAPRVVLGLVVGALLAGAGAGYQGVFRNPLADPYLLGIAAGAGLGATLAIVSGVGAGSRLSLPICAFVGALVAVGAATLLGLRGGSATTLVLAGVAVAAFFTAVQTYVQQQHAETLREVYSWILGRLSTTGWGDVVLLLPYAVLCGGVLLAAAGALDVLAVGDEEARSLGLRPGRVRAAVLVAASLATAAAVSVSGLIGFVGLVVPHFVRLVAGGSHRRVLPLSLLLGGAFLALADVVARSVQAPAELPIGVVTAFVGAPFFLLVLRTSRLS